MAEKTVAEKLLLKPGRKVQFIDPPADLGAIIGEIPEGVKNLSEETDAQAMSAPQADIIILFARDRAALERWLPDLPNTLVKGGMIWVIYFKGTSRQKTDIHRDSINALASQYGMQGVAMISIDEDRSALRLKVL